jgi:hypothetical protein
MNFCVISAVFYRRFRSETFEYRAFTHVTGPTVLVAFVDCFLRAVYGGHSSYRSKLAHVRAFWLMSKLQPV